MVEFALPWMFALLPLPLLVYWLSPPFKEQSDSLQVPFFSRLVTLTGQKPTPGATVLSPNWIQKLLTLCCWLLVVIALAKPQLLEEPIIQVESARDLMLIVDLSQSMETEDFLDPQGNQINRLEAVKLVLNDFIEHRQRDNSEGQISDRLGLILFGTKAYLQLPFTQDSATARFLLNEAQTGMAGAQTMLGDAIGFGIQTFESSQAQRRVAILLTDGNDTGSQVAPSQAADIAAQKNITLYTVAIGDPDTAGDEKLDTETLEEIAQTTGGSFFLANDREGLAAIYSQLDELEPEEVNSRSYQPKKSLFTLPLTALLILAMGYHLIMAIRSLTHKEETVGELAIVDNIER